MDQQLGSRLAFPRWRQRALALFFIGFGLVNIGLICTYQATTGGDETTEHSRGEHS